ncbi:hypothetical protein EJ02DRAFT_456992, partial [Clathrospora elynae]
GIRSRNRSSRLGRQQRHIAKSRRSLNSPQAAYLSDHPHYLTIRTRRCRHDGHTTTGSMPTRSRSSPRSGGTARSTQV